MEEKIDEVKYMYLLKQERKNMTLSIIKELTQSLYTKLVESSYLLNPDLKN